MIEFTSPKNILKSVSSTDPEVSMAITIRRGAELRLGR
jgi:hypothetical protein